MRKYYSIYIGLIALLGLASCEDIVEIDLEEGETQFVVDAFINNQFKEQQIRLSYTKPYFQSSRADAVVGATVTVEELNGSGRVLSFTDPDEDGIYTWMPASEADTLMIHARTAEGVKGDFYENQYRLEVQHGEYTFESYTSIERVPSIDSLKLVTVEASLFFPVETIVGELWATDFQGKDDFYWLKTWKNGRLLDKVQEIVLVHDIIPGLNNNPLSDGTPFIPPVRLGVNPTADADDAFNTPFYEVGDSIYVELHSITGTGFNFMSEMQSNMSNGGLFAPPIVNVPTNIIPMNEKSEGKVVGIFCGSAISTIGVKITEQPPKDDSFGF
ncbi:DUF4249 domain-containing protein [Algivirga pacifica]|uniref:DUF4249 domain-containing protein n=1 Tax=Algivirga pacifica TaxID=1162670 RepID=A0ABP9DEC3_9BACT